MSTLLQPTLTKSRVYDKLRDLMDYAELKRLVYTLVALQQKKRFRTLSVLSAYAGEGKTLFTAALAMAYAQTCSSRVLVVDAVAFHHPDSLVLKDCLDPSMAQIEFQSLSDLRKEPIDHEVRPFDASRLRAKGSMEAVVVEKRPINMSLARASDHALISYVASDRSKEYGLVLLDTVPLTTKNKGNIDPLLVASLSDASVLMVSQKLLNAPDLSASLTMLQNPALHLLGIVSNEDFNR